MDAQRIVLGLGNPGIQYRSTRHNIGFRVVDLVADRRGVTLRAEGELKSRAWLAETHARGGRLVLAKPRTMMNRAGRAALALCRHYDAPPEALLVIYDDADLALGRIRIRRRGGTGGHNGLRSMVECLGSSAFPRVRVGVRGAGRDDQDLADYVLDPFSESERPIVEPLIERAADAVETVLAEGIERAMNRYNQREQAQENDSD
jgi:PTH1 family peptidyl-tRNA hydrolase